MVLNSLLRCSIAHGHRFCLKLNGDTVVRPTKDPVDVREIAGFTTLTIIIEHINERRGDMSFSEYIHRLCVDDYNKHHPDTRIPYDKADLPWARKKKARSKPDIPRYDVMFPYSDRRTCCIQVTYPNGMTDWVKNKDIWPDCEGRGIMGDVSARWDADDVGDAQYWADVLADRAIEAADG